MTVFEKEMRDFLSKDKMLTNKVFCDKMMIGELNKNINVKLEFKTGIVADNYYYLFVEIINKVTGRIDCHMFKFNDVWRKTSNENYYIWCNRDDVNWYINKPTKAQKDEFVKIIYNYIKLYKGE